MSEPIDYDDLCKRLREWKHAAIRRDGSTLATMTEAADALDALREQVAAKDAEIRKLLSARADLEEAVATLRGIV